MGETAKPPPIRLAQSRNRYVLNVITHHTIQLHLSVVLVNWVQRVPHTIGIRVTSTVTHQPHLRALVSKELVLLEVTSVTIVVRPTVEFAYLVVVHPPRWVSHHSLNLSGTRHRLVPAQGSHKHTSDLTVEVAIRTSSTNSEMATVSPVHTSACRSPVGRRGKIATQ